MSVVEGHPKERRLQKSSGQRREVFTLPLMDGVTNQQHGLLTFEELDQSSLFSQTGEDRAGFLAFATKLFEEFEVLIESCHGARMKHTQGSFFELTHNAANEDNARRMCKQLRLKPRAFSPRPLVPFDRVFDLGVDVWKDGCGLLFKGADFLARNDVNVKLFRADKDDLGGLAGLPEVEVTARLEVPPGLDLGFLQDGLAGAFPTGTRLTLKEVVKLRDGEWVPGEALSVFRS